MRSHAGRHIPEGVMDSIDFTLVNRDLRHWSAANLTESTIYSKRVPKAKGPQDAMMGTMNRAMKCMSCELGMCMCTGHLGCIELVFPIVNQECVLYLPKVLKSVCWDCSGALLPCTISPVEGMDVVGDEDEKTAKERVKRVDKYKTVNSRLETVLEKTTGSARLRAVAALSSKVRTCGRCHSKQPRVTIKGLTWSVEWPVKKATVSESRAAAVEDEDDGLDDLGIDLDDIDDDIDDTDPEDRSCEFKYQYEIVSKISSVIRFVSDEDATLLGFNPAVSKPSGMIFKSLPTGPPLMRPAMEKNEGDGIRGQTDTTVKYQSIIKLNKQIIALKAEIDKENSDNSDAMSNDENDDDQDDVDDDDEKIERVSYKKAMTAFKAKFKNRVRNGTSSSVNDVAINKREEMDEIYRAQVYESATNICNKIPGVKPSLQRKKAPTADIRSNLKGKKGRFRGNLSGKRVNFGARSVINPESHLHMKKIGVPHFIAKFITLGEKVHENNIHRLSQAVSNGPDIHPGANYITTEDGKKVSLRFIDTDRVVIQKGMVVHRHMISGDRLKFGRQPTLHAASLMVHIAHVFYKTMSFGLPTEDTNPYNADYDGDEMNGYADMTIEARCEGDLMAVENNLLNPQNGTPLFNFVHDSISGMTRWTEDGRDFTKESSMQLWAQCLTERAWPDEAVQHFDVPGTDTITGKQLFSLLIPECVFLEAHGVVIKAGHLVSGKMGKKSLGALVHLLCIHCNPFDVTDFMSDAQVMAGWFLSTTAGCSMSISDCLNPIQDRTDALIKLATEWIGNLGPVSTDSIEEGQICELLNTLRDQVGVEIMDAIPDGTNPLVDMVRSGAKGSPVNIVQIMGLLGQQYLQSRRMMNTLSIFSPEEFASTESSAVGKGMVVDSFSKGLRAIQYYFHAIGGREGLVDTAVSTSVTGYLQRRLIKALEDLKVDSDLSVRTATGILLCLRYGFDGFMASRMLSTKLPTLLMSDPEMESAFGTCPEITSLFADRDSVRRSLMLNSPTTVIRCELRTVVPFEDIWAARGKVSKMCRPVASGSGSSAGNPVLLVADPDEVLCREQVADSVAAFLTYIDGAHILTKLDPSVDPGGDDEHSQTRALIRFWFNSRKVTDAGVTASELKEMLMDVRTYLVRGTVVRHTMCGAKAACSMGGCSTQMTLNTFHYAGGRTSLASGVPRIKEIIGAAKTTTMKTPSMSIALDREKIATYGMTEKQFATHVATSMSSTALRDIVTSSTVVSAQDSVDAELVSDWSKISNPVDEYNFGDSVLRLRIDKEECVSRLLTLSRVCKAIHAAVQGKLSKHDIIHSMVGDDEWVIRIRLDRSSTFYYHLVEKQRKACGNMRSLDQSFLVSVLGRRLCNEVVLSGLEGLDKGMTVRQVPYTVVDEKDGSLRTEKRWFLDTNGTNFSGIRPFLEIDWENTQTNSIAEIREVLGVAAASRVIEREMRKVMQDSGSRVDTRHIKLVASVMTRDGEIDSFTRFMAVKKLPVLARACYETAGDFAVDAATFGKTDHLLGPTENVIVGKLSGIGTANTRGVNRVFSSSNISKIMESDVRNKKQRRNQCKLVRAYDRMGRADLYGDKVAISRPINITHNSREMTARLEEAKLIEDLQRATIVPDYGALVERIKNARRIKSGNQDLAALIGASSLTTTGAVRAAVRSSPMLSSAPVPAIAASSFRRSTKAKSYFPSEQSWNYCASWKPSEADWGTSGAPEQDESVVFDLNTELVPLEALEDIFFRPSSPQWNGCLDGFDVSDMLTVLDLGASASESRTQTVETKQYSKHDAILHPCPNECGNQCFGKQCSQCHSAMSLFGRSKKNKKKRKGQSQSGASKRKRYKARTSSSSSSLSVQEFFK
jgi:DNA-directed RNA polymerase beta' subunit